MPQSAESVESALTPQPHKQHRARAPPAAPPFVYNERRFFMPFFMGQPPQTKI